MTSSAKAETTYLALSGSDLPRWNDVVPGGRHVEHPGRERRSIYLDTDERDLRRWGCILGYRTPGPGGEAGWELIVPGTLGTELHVTSSDSDVVPDELTAAVAGLAGGKPLRRSVTVGIGEERHEWYDRKDRLIARIGVETVSATVIGAVAGIERWQQIHVDIGSKASKKQRSGIAAALAGTEPVPKRSELDRALAAVDADPNRATPVAEGSSPHRVLGPYLDTQIQVIGAGDVWLRRGLDPIHPVRIAIRRLRSALRVFHDLFESSEAIWLDTELAWYAGLLGHVRDRQVQRARFAVALETLPPELVMGPVATRIDTDLHADQRRRLDEVSRTLDSDRYRTLLVTLGRWRAQPPLTEVADGERIVVKATRRAERKADKWVRAAADGGDEEALHRAHKAAKRARCATEVATPLLGRRQVKRNTARYRNIQHVLGEHQDSAAATDLLREFGARAGTTPGENGFTFGLLYGLEIRSAERTRRDVAGLAT